MTKPRHDGVCRPIPFTTAGDGWIWSGEHAAWWRPRLAGYTTHKPSAGIYSRAEFDRIASGCGPEKRLTFEPIPAHLMEVR